MDIKRKFNEVKLRCMQKKVTWEYNRKGLTDEVLEKQIRINTLRSELNISDKSKAVYENYVQ